MPVQLRQQHEDRLKKHTTRTNGTNVYGVTCPKLQPRSTAVDPRLVYENSATVTPDMDPYRLDHGVVTSESESEAYDSSDVERHAKDSDSISLSSDEDFVRGDSGKTLLHSGTGGVGVPLIDVNEAKIKMGGPSMEAQLLPRFRRAVIRGRFEAQGLGESENATKMRTLKKVNPRKYRLRRKHQFKVNGVKFEYRKSSQPSLAEYIAGQAVVKSDTVTVTTAEGPGRATVKSAEFSAAIGSVVAERVVLFDPTTQRKALLAIARVPVPQEAQKAGSSSSSSNESAR